MINFEFLPQTLNLEITYTRELEMNDTTIGKILEETIFTNKIEAVRKYLSSYGTLFDGINFYYDENILLNYSNKQQQQIVMCEILNFIGLYHISGKKLKEKKLENIKNENFLYLYAMGLTTHKVQYSQSIRDELISRYIKKHGEMDTIVFGPNENTLNYLFLQMLEGHGGVIKYLPGGRIDNGTHVYIETFSANLFMTKNSPLFCRVNVRYKDMSKINNTRWDFEKIIIQYIFFYDKKTKQLVGKKDEEYSQFADALKTMRQLTK